jgi:ammonia channel protein AmtB
MMSLSENLVVYSYTYPHLQMSLSENLVVYSDPCPHLQMMFASITPLLITGAIAERMRLLGFLVFIIVYDGVVSARISFSRFLTG